MPRSAILPSQKNDLLRLLTEAGFNATDFQWEELPAGQGEDCSPAVLTHGPTGFYCKFAPDRSGSGRPYTLIEYSPGQDNTVIQTRVDSGYAWSEVVSRWMTALKTEINTPDLWASAANPIVQATTVDRGNEPFTAAERAQVVIFLQEIRQYIQPIPSVSSEQFAIVEGKLQYLQDASERLGRKDWLLLFLGVLLSTAAQINMQPSVFRDLLSFAGQVFQQILGSFLSLPMPH